MTDVSLFFYRFINYQFDVDEFLRKFIVDDKQKKIDLRTIVNNINYIIKSKKFISDLMKVTTVTKSTVILKHDYDNIYLFITYWNIIANLSNMMKKKFKKVKNEYYMCSNDEANIKAEMIFKTKIINVIIVVFKNRKEIVKVIKIRRSDKKNGASNL